MKMNYIRKTDSFRDYLNKEYGIGYDKSVEFIEEDIPLSEQIEYTDYSQRRREAGYNDKSFEKVVDILRTSTDDDNVKMALSDMAGMGSVEALNFLTEFAERNKGKYDYWPSIARNECKGNLVYDLTGEVKIYILSPCGSVNGKIKFRASFCSATKEEFTPQQKTVIKKEFAFQDSRNHTETLVRFRNHFCRLVILMPLDVPILSTLANTLQECNLLGCNINIESLTLKNFV